MLIIANRNSLRQAWLWNVKTEKEMLGAEHDLQPSLSLSYCVKYPWLTGVQTLLTACSPGDPLCVMCVFLHALQSGSLPNLRRRNVNSWDGNHLEHLSMTCTLAFSLSPWYLNLNLIVITHTSSHMSGTSRAANLLLSLTLTRSRRLPLKHTHTHTHQWSKQKGPIVISPRFLDLLWWPSAHSVPLGKCSPVVLLFLLGFRLPS